MLRLSYFQNWLQQHYSIYSAEIMRLWSLFNKNLLLASLIIVRSWWKGFVTHTQNEYWQKKNCIVLKTQPQPLVNTAGWLTPQKNYKQALCATSSASHICRHSCKCDKTFTQRRCSWMLRVTFKEGDSSLWAAMQFLFFCLFNHCGSCKCFWLETGINISRKWCLFFFIYIT